VTAFRLVPLVILGLLQTTGVIAGQAEEKTALAEILPRFKEAWNAGDAKAFMAIFHPDCPVKKAYDKDEKSKDRVHRSFKETVEQFGKVESFEIRKYIERKHRYVVRVTYAKKGMIPGTFAVKEDGDKGWFILDFNIDGQGEPELKD
jgi:hypothetical protein